MILERRKKTPLFIYSSLIPCPVGILQKKIVTPRRILLAFIYLAINTIFSWGTDLNVYYIGMIRSVNAQYFHRILSEPINIIALLGAPSSSLQTDQSWISTGSRLESDRIIGGIWRYRSHNSPTILTAILATIAITITLNFDQIVTIIWRDRGRDLTRIQCDLNRDMQRRRWQVLRRCTVNSHFTVCHTRGVIKERNITFLCLDCGHVLAEFWS